MAFVSRKIQAALLGLLLAGGGIWASLLAFSLADKKRADELESNRANYGVNYLETAGNVDLSMVWIPGGAFQMGSRLGPEELRERFHKEIQYYADELPLHDVELDGFWLGRTEVTVGQYAAFAEASGYKTLSERRGWSLSWNNESNTWDRQQGLSWKDPEFPQASDEPVVQIVRPDAEAFCVWLSRETGMRYCLPSEAQWEYACRAGTATVFSWGDDEAAGAPWTNAADWSVLSVHPDFEVFPFDDGAVFLRPAGSYRPNGFGLYDMIGGVREWCRDTYDSKFYGKSPRLNPVNLSGGKLAVLRGGSWADGPWNSRSACRNGHPFDRPSSDVGFRVARTVKPPALDIGAVSHGETRRNPDSQL
jgi:sulfatase modifying factor 1